jgi:intein/homing endonuclease
MLPRKMRMRGSVANIGNVKHMDVIMEQGTELIDFYRRNPCIAAYDLCNVDLAPIQRTIFEDMWFKNYVIAVVSRGGGKSQSTNSISFIENVGMCYLHEEFPKIPTFLNPGDTLELEYDKEILTNSGFKSVKKVSLEKEIDGLKLKTNTGFDNKGSYHHPLLTIDEEGNFYYKQLQDFKIGDYVCIKRGSNVYGVNEISEEDAYLIGLFIGDGLISSRYSFQSITTSDYEIKDFCVTYCDKHNISYRVHVDKRTDNTINIIFKKFDWFFEKYNIKRSLSYYKEIPLVIRRANKCTQINFLRGLFDTDGGFERKGIVTLCSTSKKLIKEVQIMLLNMGIISDIRNKKTKSKFGRAFILTISSTDLLLFSSEIGFRLNRKQKLLENYLQNKKLNTNKNVIPFVKDTLLKKLNISKEQLKDLLGGKRQYSFSNRHNLTYDILNRLLKNLDNDSSLYDKLKEDVVYCKLKNISETDYYYDEVISIERWSGDCYDFEMDVSSGEDPNYFSNGFINHNTFMQGLLAVLYCLLYPGYRVGLIGPSFRQSKYMFAEVEKLYAKSSIVREACEKKPIRATDMGYLKFKAVGGRTGSYIEALPLGVDGAKIRGSRFYLVCVDELAQVPDKILDLVVRPFAAVSLEPMENVRRLKKQQELLEQGLILAEEIENETINKMVMTSSGFFKFNHMWRRMKDHWEMMNKQGDASRHAVHQVPYWFLPTGFLVEDSIREAQRTMSSYEFKMEYEASMISDSEGFFKASLLEACTIDSGFNIELRGDPEGKYVIGVDPNQGGDASCGIVVIKLGTINKIVNVLELRDKTTQGLTEAIQRIFDAYNVMRIFMDKGGGGKAVMDLLEDGYDGHEPLIDRTDKDKNHMKGLHVLEMVNFNPAWISDANFTTLSLLEERRLRFPEVPLSPDDRFSIIYDNITKLKAQMLNIIVTQTPSGLLHFDTPKKGQNKDLYSAVILAAYGARLFEKELEEEGEPILFTDGGMIRNRVPGATWNPLEAIRTSTPRIVMDSGMGFSAAVLKKRIK